MHNETTTATAEPVFTHSDFQTRETPADDKKGSRFTTGLVLGSIAGAAAALLLAPKKGNELREDLRDTSVKLKEKTKQMKDETMLKAKLGKMDVKDTVNSIKEKTSNLSVSARQKLQEAKNTASEVKNETKEAVNEAKREAESQTTSNSSAGLSPTPTSSISTTKTGTDHSYVKKQSDLKY